MFDDQDGCEWVSFFWYQFTWVVPDQRPLNGVVCVCVCLNYLSRQTISLFCFFIVSYCSLVYVDMNT